MSNRFFITVLVLLALIGGIFVTTKKKDDPANTTTTAQATNHVKGNGKSGVVLIEYGDFQCPACGQYYPIVKQLYEKYQDQITFQFRNFPLVQIHPNAMLAHKAAQAADKQGKFWEMHDLLYENQKSWSSGTNPAAFLESYASQLGLDVVAFKADIASSETNDIINADIKTAQDLGATGTPTFVLDGKKLEQTPGTIEDFSKLIDDAIAAKKTNS